MNTSTCSITTTLASIRAHHPCQRGWETLLGSLGKTQADDKPLTLEHILDSNGIDDAFWALRAVKGYDRQFRLFACYCAKLCLDNFEKEYPDDKRPRQAIEAAERFANGEISEEELNAARSAAELAELAAWSAWSAAESAAWSAAWSNMKQEFRRMCLLEGEYAV